jgi:Ca2+/Na+ antiporter
MRTIDKIRFALNILFLIFTVITFILFLVDGDGDRYFYTGMAALSLKVFEFILRFVN